MRNVSRVIGLIAIPMFLVIALAVVLLFLSKQRVEVGQGIEIVATIYPLAYFADGLDPDAHITTIVGTGIEPHEYQPTLRDIVVMQDADVLLVNRMVDEWAVDEISERHGPTFDAMETLEWPSYDDPHVWLNLTYAQQMVREIATILAEVDPENQEQILANAQEKIATLGALDREYREGLALCRYREILTTHDAFQYLASEYNFTSHAITGLSTEAEPSPATLAMLARKIAQDGISTVFFEEQASDAFAQTLAKETGAHVAVLYPLESLTTGDRQEEGYTLRMRMNLLALQDAMVCQK